MANVYTRRDGKPRTTTFSDFSITKDHPHEKKQLPPLFSPNRRHNPHSLGLIYQSPYNKDNLTFSIWTPPLKPIHTTLNDKFSHMQDTNWTCKHERRSVNLLEEGKPPKIRYSTSSTSRQSYQDPAERMARWHTKINCIPSRFSCNPNEDPAAGIVPNVTVLPPLYHKDGRKTSPEPTKDLTETVNGED